MAIKLMLSNISMSQQGLGQACDSLGQLLAIKLDSVLYLESNFPLALGKVEMGDGFGNCEEPMYIVIKGLWEKKMSHLKGVYALFRYESDNLPLAFIDRSDVPVKDLFEIRDRLAVSPISQRWRIAA